MTNDHSTRGKEPIRIGMIGLDTSHVTEFTKRINDPSHPGHVAGGMVVAAVPGGSPDLPISATRIPEFTRVLREDHDVKLFDSIEEMCRNVDAVMLESVDGRPHLEQVRPVIEAGRPVFVDKPVAHTLVDTIALYRLGAQHGVPLWSASSLRFHPEIVAVAEAEVGDVRGAICHGPATIQDFHPDLFWYGIHPAEALFTVLGPGCRTVTRTFTADTDVVAGVWEGDRVGVLYGLRNQQVDYKITKFGTDGIAEREGGVDYVPLLREVMKFFQTGEPPVAAETTLELYAYMEAADESRRRGGTPVEVAETLNQARSDVEAHR